MTTVYFDIDTQIDFLFPAGSLYVPGAQQLIPEVTRGNRSLLHELDMEALGEEATPKLLLRPLA